MVKKSNLRDDVGRLSSEFKNMVKDIQMSRIARGLDPPNKAVGMKRISRAIANDPLSKNIALRISKMKREEDDLNG